MLVQLDHLSIVLFNRISPEEDSVQHEGEVNLHACKKNKDEHFPVSTFHFTTISSSCNLDFKRSPVGIIFREVTKEIPRDSETTLFTLFICKNIVSEDNKDQSL